MKAFLMEFFVFGLKQARACLFAGSFFALLFLSHVIPLGPFHRYDVLFIASVAIQVVLYVTKVETKDEIKTIALFHLLGLLLELFKTHPSVGSWSYPEDGLLKIGTVPLYSGFMYAAVGSYLSQSFRIMKVKFTGPWRGTASVFLAVAIYLNFFTNHFVHDIRWILIPLVFVVYAGTWAEFIVTNKIRRMPLVLSFLLVAFFIWIAENISTYLGAWKYPHQLTTWSTVSWRAMTSWYLLVIISFILVANLKRLKERQGTAQEAD